MIDEKSKWVAFSDFERARSHTHLEKNRLKAEVVQHRHLHRTQSRVMLSLAVQFLVLSSLALLCSAARFEDYLATLDSGTLTLPPVDDRSRKAWPAALSGTLPAGSALARFSRLRHLDLANLTHLSGRLDAIGGLPQPLTFLRLSWSKVSGTIPAGLGKNQTSLTTLDFEANGEVSGTLPLELGRLAQLTKLKLNLCLKLGGDISELLGTISSNMTRLGTLDVMSVPLLSGTLPAEGLGVLTNLRELRLGHTSISGTLPITLKRLAQLTKLQTIGPLSGTLPVGLAANLTNGTEVFSIGIRIDCDNDPSGFGRFCLMAHRAEFWAVLVAALGICLLLGRRVAIRMTKGALAAKEQPTTVRVPELAFKKVFRRNTRFDFARLAFRRHLGHGQFGDVREALYVAQGRSTNQLRQESRQQSLTAGSTRLAVKTMRRELVTALQHRDVILECERHLLVCSERNGERPHPFVLQCLGWTTPPRSRDFCMVLELAEGGSLEDYLRKSHEAKKPCTSAQLVSWAIEIGFAILHVHSLDMLHRDISARNIVLVRCPDAKSPSSTPGGDGIRLVAKLTDFGLARRGTRSRSVNPPSSGFVGSMLVVSRHQADGDAELTHREPLTADSESGNGERHWANVTIPAAWAAPEVLTATSAHRARTNNLLRTPHRRNLRRQRSSALAREREGEANNDGRAHNSNLAFETSESSESWAFAVLLWEMQTQGAQPYADVEDIPAFVLKGGRLQPPPLRQGLSMNFEAVHAVPEFNEIMASIFSPPPTRKDRPSMTTIIETLEKARAVQFVSWTIDELQTWLERFNIPRNCELYEAYELTGPSDLFKNLKSTDTDGTAVGPSWDRAEEIAEDGGLEDPQLIKELYRELDGLEHLHCYVQTITNVRRCGIPEVSRQQGPSSAAAVAPVLDEAKVEEGVEVASRAVNSRHEDEAKHNKDARGIRNSGTNGGDHDNSLNHVVPRLCVFV